MQPICFPRAIRFLPLTFLICLLPGCASVPQAPVAREGIEWCDIWIAHANETNLPRVLLIGDSITRGYYPAVEQRLAGKAYVARLATSAFISDPMLLQQVSMVLDHNRFEVIQFNNGMHGWQHDEAEYGRAFHGFVANLRRHAPQAKLIWASTTPLKPSAESRTAHPGQASDARVAARNSIALDCLKGQGIALTDLYTPVLGHAEYYSDGVHFNRDGIAVQAGAVAAAIRALLP